MIIDIANALLALTPEKRWRVIEGTLYWEDESPQPTEKEINDKIAELQADYDANQYQRDRALAFDPLPEQLDQIYHDIDGWKAKIKAVKDKFPKP